MGILNVTPDSFYDGGRHEGQRAEQRVDELIEEGVDIIDLGGESTRPGSQPVGPTGQIRRIEPAARRAIRSGRVLVSIDTSSAEVADRLLSLGAHIINDVSCLRDPALAGVVARHRAVLIVMHSREPMSTMEGFSLYPEAGYDNVVADVRREWCVARDRATRAGMASEDIYFDPGFGFSKSARHSLELLRHLDEFRGLSACMVVGPSRKSFIGALDGTEPDERLGGTISACVLSVQRGARVVRVHDVGPVRQALALMHATEPQGGEGHA